MFPCWKIDICLQTSYTGQRGPAIYVSTCKRCTRFTCVREYAHHQVKIQSRQISILFLPRISFWKLSSLNCCPLSFIAWHTLWHLAPVLPHAPQTKSRRSFRVSGRRDRQHRNVTWISRAATAGAWINHCNVSILIENAYSCRVRTELLSLRA